MQTAPYFTPSYPTDSSPSVPYATGFPPTDRGAILAGLRRGNRPVAPRHQSPPNYGPVYNQSPEMTFLAQQMELQLQQQQMELQIQQMRLQNMEIERLLAAAQRPAMPSPPEPRRRTETFGGLPSNYATVPRSASFADIGFDHALEERRDALQGLQRAQQHRAVSTPQSANLETRFDRQRASFGAQSAVESAWARKALAAAVTPPRIGRQGGQHRQSPSYSGDDDPVSPSSSTGSRTLLSSPTGPTLVLSGPGETFPPSTPSPRIHHGKRLSDGSDSVSDSSEASSEVLSFESVATSVQSVGSTKPTLNPSAATFTPGMVTSAPTTVTSPPYRSLKLQLVGGPRGAVAVRQPRGPAPEEELDAKNFSARIRRRAIGVVLGRKSFNDLAGQVERHQ